MTKKNKIICLLFMAILAIVSLSWIYITKERRTFTESNDMLAVFLGEEKSKNFPTKDSGYIYNRTECTNDEEVTWNEDTWKLTISKIKKGTKCNVYFTQGFTKQEFVHKEATEEFVVPVTGNYKLEVWGAQGGEGGYFSFEMPASGGKGGYSVGTVFLEKNTTIYVNVGGQGESGNGLVDSTKKVTGGFNGGGSAEQYGLNGGGGATDIRIGENTLYHRVIVAGGGGGAGNAENATQTSNGGAGGGETGETPTNQFGSRTPGAGGTQTGIVVSKSSSITAGFGIGAGGTGENLRGAGGGGWYGGTMGENSTGGGGGSGWIYTETAFNTWQTGNPTNAANWKLDTKYYLKDASTVAGTESIPTHDGLGTMIGNSGNGYAKITLVR